MAALFGAAFDRMRLQRQTWVRGIEQRYCLLSPESHAPPAARWGETCPPHYGHRVPPSPCVGFAWGFAGATGSLLGCAVPRSCSQREGMISFCPTPLTHGYRETYFVLFGSFSLPSWYRCKVVMWYFAIRANHGLGITHIVFLGAI